MQFKAAHPADEVGAIDRRQPVAFAENDGGDTGFGHTLLGGQSFSLIEDLALAHERDGHLRHGGKIAASSYRTFLADDRGYAPIQHLDLGLYHFQPDSGMAPAMGVEAGQ